MNLARTIKVFSLIRALTKSDFGQASGLMSEMHGFPQKLGQHFTLYLGGGVDRYFDSLCSRSRAENIDINQTLAELNLDYDQVEIYAQASIGQVYRVQAKPGLMAVKVRYPGVEKRIKDDFGLLRGILWPLKFLPMKNSSLVPLLAHVNQMLLSECDYWREAADQIAFHRFFRNDPDILIPKVAAYSDSAIASQWVDGFTPDGGLDCLALWFIETYLRFIVKSLTGLGLMHSDPHPGNFIITGQDAPVTGDQRAIPARLAVLDFGSVIRFTTEEAGAVTRLLCGEYDSEIQLLCDLETLGIGGDALEVYRPVIGDLVSILMEPFYFPENYDFADWRMQYKLNTILASRSWEKPLPVPPKLLLLVRTLQGLYFYSRRNAVSMNWHKSIRKCLE